MRLDSSDDRNAAAGLEFFRDHRHRLGHIVCARVRAGAEAGAGHTLILRDDAGAELRLSGPAAGRPNEAARLAMQVLVEAGFPAEQARRVFTEPNLHLHHNPRPADRWARRRAARAGLVLRVIPGGANRDRP